jgi:hypothetical protein
MAPRFPKSTSGHLDRSNLFLVSRGRIRISTLRCPEVGLEFQLLGVQRSDCDFNFDVFVSRIGFDLSGCRLSSNARACG